MNLLRLQEFAELLIKGSGLPFRQYPDQFNSSSAEQIQKIQLETAAACKNLDLYKNQTGDFVTLFLETFVEFRFPPNLKETKVFDALVRTAVQSGYVITLCEKDFNWDIPNGFIGKRSETILEMVCSGLEREINRKFPSNPPVKIRTMATYAGYVLGRLGLASAMKDLGSWKTVDGSTHIIYRWTIG